MRLKLACKDFQFHSGRALLFPQGDAHRNYPADFEERLQLVRSREFVLADGSIDVNDDIGAGPYRLSLHELSISRVARPGSTVNVPFFIHDFEISEEDIQAGAVEVRLAPEGLYRITLRSMAGELLPCNPLTFQLDLFSITAESGMDGSIFCLGSPFHFFIDIVGFSLTITPE